MKTKRSSLAGSRSWFERGTLRNPGPHLDRMPIGFDLSGISLAEGVRAAIASGIVLLASVWLDSFPLLIAAFAANLTCFCDTGGVLATRLKALVFFTVVGALCWMGFGLLRNLGWPFILPFAGVAIFLCSMARVWGLAAQAVGNVLIVTVALALDAPLQWHEALVLGASFIGGGLWAVVLTLVIWRIHPSGPATQALDQVWSRLAALTGDLRTLAVAPLDPNAWDAHARAHRRATRGAIEEAHVLVTASVKARGPTSHIVRRTVVRLDAAESIFAALIAFSDVIEAGSPQLREQGAVALRLLRPVLVLAGKGVFDDFARFEPVLDRMQTIAAGTPALAPVMGAIVDALRVTLRTTLPEQAPTPEPARPPTLLARLREAVRPLRDNLTWDSDVLRHGARATVLTVPALAWSLIWWSPYSHWLTITVALTMQPYFAATWQRVLERIGGTLLGGLIGAGIAFLPPTHLMKAVLLVPLCVIGFSVRQVSYGAFIACLTPLVVVLFDVAVPGHSDATIAGMRLFYTVAGGALALAACTLLWPTWEPDRLEREIGNALLAHARVADAIFSASTGEGPWEAAEPARRAAGVANNNLEASLSRSLQEPLRTRDPLVDAGLVIDAAIRRLGGTLITLQHELPSQEGTDHEGLQQWRRWVVQALGELAQGRRLSEAAPPARVGSTISRLRLAIDLIDKARAGHHA